jgi:hypothetical protein
LPSRKPNNPPSPEPPPGEDADLEGIESLEDLKGLPNVQFPEDDEVSSVTQTRNMDLYEDPFPQSDTGKFVTGDTGRHSATGPTAPAVSQGPWRERAFRPRGSMPREQVISELERALALAGSQKEDPGKAWVQLKADWLPLLRQAVEQAGGDGLDGLLSSLMGKPRTAQDPLVADLVTQMAKLNRTSDPRLLIAESKKAVDVVKKALNDKARKISLKWLETELEGRIEVDTLLSILFADDDDLARRLQSVNRAVDQLREQFRGMPGAHPDGMFSNYSRLKVEKRVIEAEQKRRGPRG